MSNSKVKQVILEELKKEVSTDSNLLYTILDHDELKYTTIRDFVDCINEIVDREAEEIESEDVKYGLNVYCYKLYEEN